MSRIVFEGNYKIYWSATVASKTAPSAATDFGTEITKFVPKDGLRYGPSFNKVDASNISSGFDPEYQGSWRMDSGLTVQWDDGTNTAVDLFATHGTLGYLIALPEATASSPAVGDKAFVIPVDASIAVPNNTAPNALQTMEVSLAVTEEPSFAAVVAA